jgi:hypothetical protein
LVWWGSRCPRHETKVYLWLCYAGCSLIVVLNIGKVDFKYTVDDHAPSERKATLRLTNTKPKPQFKCGIFLGMFIYLNGTRVTKRYPCSAHSAHTEPETHTKALPTSN